MNKTLTPCLWFDTQAEEAVNFYVSIFPNSKIGATSRYDEASAKASGRPAGSVLTISFELSGNPFMALNGGPIFKFTEAISFVVPCKDQKEVDWFWEKLGEGGDPKSQQCGWLKDEYGISWQIVPDVLGKLLASKEPGKAKRAMEAMLGMKKLVIADLERAADSA